jgi:hypothetical protein
MEKLDQLKLDLQIILNRNIPNSVKNLVLEGLLQELKFL